MPFKFYTNDHPQNKPGGPKFGDVGYVIDFSLENDDKLYVHVGQKGKEALWIMLLEDSMIPTNEQLPELNIRVLVFDSNIKHWVFGELRLMQGTKHWMFDPKIFHGLDNNRFSHWMQSPELPGATRNG
jgi:hypothetical protein